jgi:hypothetical protein
MGKDVRMNMYISNHNIPRNRSISRSNPVVPKPAAPKPAAPKPAAPKPIINNKTDPNTKVKKRVSFQDEQIKRIKPKRSGCGCGR